MKVSAKKVGAIAISIAFVSAIAGVVTGILFAPKSGKETRKDIKDKADEIKSKVNKEVIPEVKKEYQKVKKAVSKEIGELKNKGKKLVKQEKKSKKS